MTTIVLDAEVLTAIDLFEAAAEPLGQAAKQAARSSLFYVWLVTPPANHSKSSADGHTHD